MIMNNYEIQDIYISYLDKYIREITRHKNEFFISISDIEFEIIDIFKNIGERFEDDVKIVTIDKTKYEKAVKYRNDINIKKIILLTTDSVKKIDSLKDFVEYPILPDDRELFWELMVESYDLEFTSSVQANKVKKHIFTLLFYKRVSFSEVCKYLLACVNWGNIKNALSDKKLNQNLNMLMCWRSNEERLISDKILRKIIRSSEPFEIEKKLSGLSNSASDNLSEKEKKDIASLVYKNDYEKLFNKYYFNKVQSLFKGNTARKINNVNEGLNNLEENYQYKYSYDEALQYKDVDMESFENGVVDLDNEFYGAVSKNSIKTLYEIEKDSFLQKINMILETVSKINMKLEEKQYLCSKIEEFKNETIVFLEKIFSHKASPIKLFSYCKDAEVFCSTYFEIMTLMVTNLSISRALERNNIIQIYQLLFTIEGSDTIKMLFFHPIFILYLCSVKVNYEKLLIEANDCAKDSIDQKILIGLMQKSIKKFPIQIMLSNEDRYFFNNNYDSIPFYVEFSKKSFLSSNSQIESRLVYNKIIDYISRNKYKSEIKVSIIGQIGLNDLNVLHRKISKLLEETDNLLNMLTLDLISSDEWKMKEEIDKLSKSDNLFERMRIRFIKPNADRYLEFCRITIAQSDLVFFVDTSILYKNEELSTIITDKNYKFNKIKKLDFNEEINNFSKGSDILITTLWDTLHSLFLHGDVELSKWNINSLDYNLINIINEQIDINRSIAVCILTSNTSILDDIYVEKKKYCAKYLKNNNRDILDISFSYESSDSIIEKSGLPCEAFIILRDLLESILSQEDIDDFINTIGCEPKEALISFLIYFRYNYETKEIEIRYVCPNSSKETLNIDDYLYITNFIMDQAFNSNSVIGRSMKRIIISSLYNSIKTYASALLVYHLETSYTFNPKNLKFAFYDKVNEIGKRNVVEIQNVIGYLHNCKDLNENFKYTYQTKFKYFDLISLFDSAKELGFIDNKSLNTIKFLIGGVNS